MKNPMKKYNTIGACGIDCGLCPRYYTQGNSACPGCGGKNFLEKHPACGCLSCCVNKHALETCSECPDYPCAKFDPEKITRDSFVTHGKIFANLDLIKKRGLDVFIPQQKARMAVLKSFLTHYDDGRSKSFFCIACALLPLEHLQKALGFAETLDTPSGTREKAKPLKEELQRIAGKLKIPLKLNSVAQ